MGDNFDRTEGIVGGRWINRLRRTDGIVPLPWTQQPRRRSRLIVLAIALTSGAAGMLIGLWIGLHL